MFDHDDVPVKYWSILERETNFPSVPHVAGNHVLLNVVRVPVSKSYDLNIPEAIVPAFITKNLHVSTAKVSVFATAQENAGENVIVEVQPGTTKTSVMTDSLPAWDHVSILSVFHLASHDIAAVVVIVDVVDHVVAVTVFDRLCLHQHDQAPKAPTNAHDGICTHPSSSWW